MTCAATRLSPSLSVLIVSGLSLTACGGDAAPVVDGGVLDASDSGRGDAVRDAARDATEASFDPFPIWREIRTATRTNQDHLPARVDLLVGARDLAGLLTLVQNEISTYPPSDDSLVGMDTRVRWGTRATLRGAGGTPREKAELLAELYRRAEFEAEVVAGDLEAGIDVKSLFLRSVTPSLSGISSATIDRWFVQLGRPRPTTYARLVEPASVTALADRVEAAAGQGSSAFTWPGASDVVRIPLVRVRPRGAAAWQHHANPNVPGSALGMTRTRALPDVAADAFGEHEVTAKIEIAKNDAPFERITVVEKTWNASDVAGRRIVAGFVPSVARTRLMRTRPSDVEAVIPMLVVTGPSVDRTTRDALSVVGSPITRTGDQFEITDTSLRVNGQEIGRTATDPAALARIAGVAVRVDQAQFPVVDLHVSVRDSGGASVAGLGADAFNVADVGVNEGFVLLRNQPTPPRVLLLFDNSDSIPADFRGPGAVALGRDIAARVRAFAPASSYRVATVDFGLSYQGPWTSTLSEVDAQLALIAGTGSDIWQAAADANGLATDDPSSKPTVIVLVTDAVPSDEASAAFERRIASGAPVIVLRVGATTDAVVAGRLAALSNGASVAPASAAAAATAVEDAIRARTEETYVLRYTANATTTPSTDAGAVGDRSVRVLTPNNGTMQTVTYTPPATPVVAPRVSSVWLTITSEGRTSSRLIGGLNRPQVIPAPEPNAAELRDADAALFATVIATVEGAPPTSSVWFEERANELLSLEPLFRALERNDNDTADHVLDSAFHTPTELIHLNSRFAGRADSSTLVFETGLRITSFTERPAPEMNARFRSVDIWPHTTFAAAGSDARVNYRRTLEQSAKLMLTEGRLFTNSTQSLVGTAALRAIRASTLDTDLASLTDADRGRWRHTLAEFADRTVLIGAPSSPNGYYLLSSSGTLMAMLYSGGGEGNGYEADRQMINNVFGGAGAAGLITPGLEAWSSLERTKLLMLSHATEIIDTGTTDSREFFENAFCDAAQDALSPIPGADEFFEIVGAMELGAGLGGSLSGGDTPMSPIPCL